MNLSSYPSFLYVCVCVCGRARARACIYIDIYGSACVCMYVDDDINAHLHPCTHTYYVDKSVFKISISANNFSTNIVNIYTYVYIYLCVCLRAHVLI